MVFATSDAAFKNTVRACRRLRGRVVRSNPMSPGRPSQHGDHRPARPDAAGTLLHGHTNLRNRGAPGRLGHHPLHSHRDCLKLGDGVFDSQRHPWVDLTLASTDTVVAAVTACPSGALTYERLDGEQGEQSAVPTTVVPWPNGPLLVRGAIEVSDRHGDIFTSAPRAALCRCGSSSNQPFCDLSHRDEGFKDYPRVHSQTRHSADSPADISPTELE